MNLASTITLTTANIPAPDPGVVPLPPTAYPTEPPLQTPPQIQNPILPGECEPVRDPSPGAPTSQALQATDWRCDRWLRLWGPCGRGGLSVLCFPAEPETAE